MARVFLSYKHALPDSNVAQRVYEELHRRHHHVFFDKELRIGDRWNAEIQNALDQAEYVVAFVSLSYLNSAFILEHELGPAAKRLESGSLAGLLHVNLAYDGDPPPQVADVLRSIQFFKWRSDADTADLIEAIGRALPASQLLVRGAESFDELDAALFPALGRKEAIDELVARIRARERPHVLLHGVSGAGKTSFLRAGVQSQILDMTVLELSRGTADELRRAATRPGMLAFDQFEQALIDLSRDPDERAAFGAAVADLTAQGRRFLFCVRDEYRSAFGKMFPVVDRDCTPFALFPFEPHEAALVLEKLLENARVGYGREVLLPLCQAMADGTPPTVLPAILQMIVQHCRDREIPLTPAIRDELQRKDARSLFVDHLRQSVFERLPRSLPQLDAARTLLALTSGDVKSQPKTVAGVAADEALAPARVERTLEIASASGARVVTIDRPAEGEEAARYRLAHDLFVPAVRQLHARARVRTRWRNGVLAAVALLAAGLGTWLLPRSETAALQARREFDQSVLDAQQNRREAAALRAAQAYELAGARDPLRGTYALAALHASLALAPPAVLPRPNDHRPTILSAQVVVQTGPGVTETLVHPPDGGPPWRLPPLAESSSMAASDDARWIAGTFVEGYPTPSSVIWRNGATGRVAWENAPQAAETRFNTDASLIVARTSEGIEVWSRQTGKRIRTIRLLAEQPDLFLGAGAERLLTVTESGIEITDLRSGTVRAAPRPGVFPPARFSGDGRRFATVEAGGRLTLWDAAALQPLKELPVESAYEIEKATAFRIDAVSRDGSKVLGIGNDEGVFLVDTATGNVHTRKIDGVDFHLSDGFGSPVQRLGFLSGDRVFISLGGGTQYMAEQGESDHVTLGPYVVKTWTADGTFRQWGPVIRLPQDVFPFEVSPGGTHLRAVLHDGRVLQWDLRRRLDVTGALPEAAGFTPSLVQFTSDLHYALVAFSEDQERPQRVVDLRTGSYADEKLPIQTNPRLELLHDRFVVQHWFVREELQSGKPSRVQVLDLRTGKLLLAQPLQIRLAIHDVAMNAAGTELRLLGSGFARDGRERIVRVSLPAGSVSEPEYLAGGRRFTDDDGQTLVDITFSQEERVTFELRSTHGPARTLAFELTPSTIEPDVVISLLHDARVQIEGIERVVVTAPSGAAFRMTRRGSGIVITDPKTNAPLVFPRPEHGGFESAAFSPDGRLALLMERKGADDAMQVWDLATGRPVTQRIEIARGIAGGTFVENGKAAAVLGGDGSLRRIYVGDPSPYAPSWSKRAGAWLGDLATYATGMRLETGALVPLTQEEHGQVRERLRDALRAAAARDANARYALEQLGLK